MLHSPLFAMANASPPARMDRPDPTPSPIVEAPRSNVVRGIIAVAVLAYAALAVIAATTANGILSVLCVLILVTFVLASRLLAGRLLAWLIWFGVTALLVWLGARGRGVIALDLVPAVINAGLAWLFGSTLGRGRTPLVARAIIAIEGREHLALPRVAGYARRLTEAWTLLFVVQAIALFAVVAARNGLLGTAPSSFALAFLHFGGYVVPALFMLGEYVFRRWYLRHVPHHSLRAFIERLAHNWPRLLRDRADPLDVALKR